jgi:hypothetical protein
MDDMGGPRQRQRARWDGAEQPTDICETVRHFEEGVRELLRADLNYRELIVKTALALKPDQELYGITSKCHEASIASLGTLLQDEPLLRESSFTL